jgi:hypothetical protein
MCSSLTDQVRSIAVVTTAVARGDLTQKIEIQVKDEMSTLKGNIFTEKKKKVTYMHTFMQALSTPW